MAAAETQGVEQQAKAEEKSKSRSKRGQTKTAGHAIMHGCIRRLWLGSRRARACSAFVMSSARARMLQGVVISPCMLHRGLRCISLRRVMLALPTALPGASPPHAPAAAEAALAERAGSGSAGRAQKVVNQHLHLAGVPREIPSNHWQLETDQPAFRFLLVPARAVACRS